MTPADAGTDGDWILLHNPRSRRARRVRSAVEPIARRLANEAGIAVRWVEISRLEEIAWNPSRLIAMGGDGTVNAAASWIAERSSDLEPILAIIPAGTGNNFARDVGLPLDPIPAVTLAFVGEHTRRLDLLRFRDPESGDACFALQSGSLGFPALVAHRYDALRRYWWFRWSTAPLGQYVYRIIGAVLLVGSIVRQWCGRPGIASVVEFGTERFDEELLALFVNNERSLGGNFFPCPDADPGDGIVDVCLLRRGPARRYPGLFKAVCRANHVDRYAEVIYRRGTGPIEIELDRPLPLLVDGDLPMHPRRLRAELLPGQLSLLVPPPMTS